MPRPANPHLPKALLEASAALLDEHGDVDFSMRELASRIGYSVTAVYRAFEDRDSLLDALKGRLLAGFSMYLAPPREGAPLDRIAVIGRHHLEWAEAHPARYRFIFRPEPSADSAASERATRLVVRNLATLVRQGVEDRDIAPVDELASAAFFFSAVHGMASLAVSGRFSHPGHDHATDFYDHHHATWLKALFPAP